jgi:hypothetical protein
MKKRTRKKKERKKEMKYRKDRLTKKTPNSNNFTARHARENEKITVHVVFGNLRRGVKAQYVCSCCNQWPIDLEVYFRVSGRYLQ